MKRIVFTFLLSSLLIFPMCGETVEPIEVSGLPAKAQEFIAKHFKNEKVSLATVEKELFETSYHVVFADGSKVTFNNDGEWEEIDSKMRIHDSIIPEKILTFVKSKHPANYIKEIERDIRHYDVKLDNGLEIKFNKDFDFVSYED